MVYVKPTVHLSRIAGAALKSFTHGYAQTVVAASQSSYAAQNTSATPLADSLLGRWRKAEKHKFQNALQQVDGARQASTAAVAPRPDTSHHDSALDKYVDAWQKYQRNEPVEWHQAQLAQRVEWQPPTTVPRGQLLDADSAVHEDVAQDSVQDTRLPALKRSYTTSALNDFGKIFGDDEAAEATALAQVNDAIAEEVQRSKDDFDAPGQALRLAPSTARRPSPTASEQSLSSSPAAIWTSSDGASASSAESSIYSSEILLLADNGRYAEIPAAFQAILRSGVQKPAPSAYRALLISAIHLAQGKHQQVTRALEVYTDMLRRKVVPDTETFNLLIELLAKRSSDSISTRKALEDRLLRYGGLEEAGKFMFRSSQMEHTMLLEDGSLSIALKMFERATSHSIEALSAVACGSLVVACAHHGRVDEMKSVYEQVISRSTAPESSIFPPVIAALGSSGDLKTAVDVYDDYKDLAIANNAGDNAILRLDNQIYASLVKAYGSAGRLKGGLKFLSEVQALVTKEGELEKLREVVALDALLPLTLQSESSLDVFELTRSLTGHAYASALGAICIAAADKNLLDQSLRAFDALALGSRDLVQPSMAMMAMHVRNANVDAAEPYWRIIESAPAGLVFIEPTAMRTVALVGVGQAERGLRQARRMFSRIRDAQPESSLAEAVEQIDEAIEVIGRFMLRGSLSIQPEASAELLRTMTENGGLVAPYAEHLMARMGPEQIARLSAADTELLLRIQAGMIVNETSADIAGPARFGCLLENIITKSIMPSPETETIIERTLVNVGRQELSSLWNNYRYPQTPAFAPAPFAPVAQLQQPAFVGLQPVIDDSYDPYASKTDVKGSNVINDLLERPQGRRMNEALVKFRNMRRVGRVPRMFTYGKLIESAAKENNLTLARDVLEMAKQDVPFDARYRVVRFGWQQILDHMVAACLNLNRRDLAASYHQDLLDMGAAPSANTFGLYITTLKDTKKTFDEATDAVKIFHQAKAEGVEPSSFLYNALIGKLGKARRIDDCLFYFAEMRNLGIRPTSVTYGTIVNALCRVSDEKFAEEIFEEMESCANYKPRPAPYHSLMQYFVTTKRDRAKVLSLYERMRANGIEPTVHTFKLLIDAHATLEPVNMAAAEAVLDDMKAARVEPEAVHYASLIHAKGCVLHDLPGARALFDDVLAARAVRPQPCLYQALFESLSANHRVADSAPLLADMAARRVEYTPYIANALIHGWTQEGNVDGARQAFERVRIDKREPSTYEAAVRAYLAVEDRDAAKAVVREALGRGYPSAVAGRIADLVR